MKILELLLEILGWLRIVLSPTLISTVIGGVLYLYFKNTAGVYLGVGVAILGLIIGVVWASRTWKKEGTVNFLSKVNASPELNKDDQSQSTTNSKSI